MRSFILQNSKRITSIRMGQKTSHMLTPHKKRKKMQKQILHRPARDPHC
jgi:hypothetical protein